MKTLCKNQQKALDFLDKNDYDIANYTPELMYRRECSGGAAEKENKECWSLMIWRMIRRVPK